MRRGKILVISTILLVLFASITLGHRSININNNNNNNNNESVLIIHNKNVNTICNGTDDKILCQNLLYPIKTSNPKDYIDVVVKTSIESVVKAFNNTINLKIEHADKSNPGINMALEDCKEMLQFAIDELKASNNFVSESTSHDIYNRSIQLKNSLGAVIAYQQSCLDGFNTESEKKVKSQLQIDSLDNVGKHIGLALDVVSDISRLNMNNQLKVKPFSRSLLEVDHEGYPTWFSIRDRKLLESGPAPNADTSSVVVVAKDGSGQYTTIGDAINAYPENHQGKYVIYVKGGVYEEYITVDKKKPNIFMYGDGPTKTIITGSKSFRDDVKTMKTATFATVAEGFIAKGIAFENTAGPEGHQAVALRVQGDCSAFFECTIRGYQDTLYVHAHRQLYRNCEISGTVDFIFGYSSTLIQKSKIIVRNPSPNQKNTIVADGRSQKSMATGIVIQNCEIMPEVQKLDVKSYLARPWKEFSRAVFIENVIGNLIEPEGYIPWAPTKPNIENSYFAEFGNIGEGACVERRVEWAKGLISKEEAAQFTAQQFLQAHTWLSATGIPFDDGFTGNSMFQTHI